MKLRIEIVRFNSHPHEYLKIVESIREGGTLRPRIVPRLGRRVRRGSSGQCVTRSWSPALVFARLRVRQELPRAAGNLAEGRRFHFDPERADEARNVAYAD